VVILYLCVEKYSADPTTSMDRHYTFRLAAKGSSD
jgi:hypothetical protein